MATIDVIRCCLDAISHIADDIRGAIVYLDGGCSESFQIIGAFSLLLELGARGVCSLEKVSPLDQVIDWNLKLDPAEKVVIFTSHLLSDAHRYVLRCLSALQGVRYCTILTSISEMAHSTYPNSPLGPDAYQEYESLLVQDFEELVKRNHVNSGQSVSFDLKETMIEEEGWSQFTPKSEDVPNFEAISSVEKENLTLDEGDVRKKLSVSVHHFPIILCPFSPRVFVLPSEGSIAEAYISSEHENSISAGLPPLSIGRLEDIEDISVGASLTAQFLYHLAGQMDLKLEIFSLGDMSKTVGKLLRDMSSLYDVGRRKRSAGLLLVDRTLDLLTPCCHGDSLIDRLYSCLPRKERTTFPSLVKSSQNLLKQGASYLERESLNVQIPLQKIMEDELPSGGSYQLLEKIEAVLRGWNHKDAASWTADLSDLSIKLTGEMSLEDSKNETLKGSFVSTDNFHGTPYLEALLERKTKDGILLIKKWLQESIRRENISLNTKIRPGFPSKEELLLMVKAIAQSKSALVKNKGIIQLVAATIHALDEMQSSSWDAFSSAEKILKVNAGDTSQSLAAQISDLINKSALVGSQGMRNDKTESSKGLLSLEDALLLTIVGYILAGENFPTSGSDGPFSWQEEHFMKDALVDAIMENPTASNLKFLGDLSEQIVASKRTSTEEKEDPSNEPETIEFDDEWGNWSDEDAGKDTDKDTDREKVYGDMQLKLELRDRVDNLFKYLHKLSALKQNTYSRGELLGEYKFSDDPYSSKGMLYKLLSRLLNKHDVPGLEYHASTVGRLFKSGFGRFGLGQVKPSLADQNIIIVFVVGGINGVEVQELQEALSESSRPDVALIIGGTTFLTPNDMFDLLLGDYSYVKSL